VEIEYDIVKTVRDLQRGGSADEVIERKLGEMGYSEAETAEVMRLASRVDSVEKGEQSKKFLLAIGAGFVALVVFMAICAVLFG
jgi:hypothetical protein